MRYKFLFLLIAVAAVAYGRPAYTLEQLRDSALTGNNAMRSARHDIAAATEQRREAFTNYFPTVSATGLSFAATQGMMQMDINPGEMLPASLVGVLAQSMPAEALAGLATPIGVSMMKHGTLAGVSAVQPVFAGGRIVNGNRLARLGEDVSQLRLELSTNDVLRTTEQYYWQLVTMREKLRTLDAVAALLDGLNKDVTVAVNAGVTLRNDLLQVQLRQNDIESQRLKLLNGQAVVKMLLAQHCALSDTAFDIVAAPDFNPSLPPRLDHGQALLATPEYRLLDKQVEAAALQTKMERGKAMPTVSVGVGYNYHNLLGKGTSFGMAFATVSVPITDWWGTSHAVKRKRLEEVKARDQLADNSELLTIKMQSAWNSVMEARDQLSLAARGIEQAEENLRINRDHYRAGVSRMSDLLEAQLLYQQALDRRADALAAYHNSCLEYRLATAQ